MKRALSLITVVLAASFTQAQVLHVNNTDGTYLATETKDVQSITFDQEQKLVSIASQSRGANVTSTFATEKVQNIALETACNEALTYDLNPTISVESSAPANFYEIADVIETDENKDEYGDFVENFSSKQVITVTFSEGSVKTGALPSGITATIDKGHIVINSSNSGITYTLKGTSSNGSIKIYSTKKFRIFTNRLTLTNPTGPAINIQSGKSVYFSIADGTTNTLCDGETYAAPTIAADGTEEDQKGTLFSEGQLIFDGYNAGTGKLEVTSKGGHAICSDDYIRVRGGNISIVSAAKDGFRTKEQFIIGRTEAYSPTITINATNNGIDCSEGTLTINAGKLNITSGSEAIKVEYEEEVPDAAVKPDVYIKGGYISTQTTGEKSSAIKCTGNYTHSGGILHAQVNGNGSKIINSDGNVTIDSGKLTGIAKGTTSSDNTSAGGIKCDGKLIVNDGEIAIDCTGKGAKGINCNNSVTVEGGNITLLAKAQNDTSSSDDKKSRAITASTITVNGGKVVASAYDHALNATEGIELNGGAINAYSSTTDALNFNATQTGGWLLTKDAE